MNFSTTDLPALNAFWNLLATLCLLAGLISIKQGQKERHKKWMLSALFCSAIFLGGYLIYHAEHGSRPFPNLGWIKTVYLLILIPHIILAAVMMPFIAKTFWHAFRQEWVLHKKWAKITFPIWLYVSVTGIIIYLMLYQWFAPSHPL